MRDHEGVAELRSEHSRERDAALARAIVARGTILRTLVGSTVHGLSNPGTDDRDETAVCVEPPDHVVGLRSFEHYVARTQPDGAPSGPGDLDLSVYGLRKFCRLALKGSPTVLLVFFVTGDDVLVCEPLGEELRGLAPAFLSQRTGRSFLGYLDAQRRALLSGAGGNRTRELSREHGYDTKYAMHALRIAAQGTELLTTGRITLPVPEPDRSRLMEVRRGEVPVDEVAARLERAAAGLEDAAARTALPARPDADRINAFLVDAHLRFWRE